MKGVLNIQIKAQKPLKVSTWAFDPNFLETGDSATITGWVVAHATNPLYIVKRDKDGLENYIHRNLLVECGALK